MTNHRTVETDISLQRTLSRSRLTKYLEYSAGDLTTALDVYERNMRLSEAFYTPLQCVEISLRNTVHRLMTDCYGRDWMTNAAAGLSTSSAAMIGQAIGQLRKSGHEPSHDDIVSELKFAFWVGMLGPGYDQTLWRKVLYTGFRNARHLKRSVIQGRFNAIRRFRNRVAHHEPIFHKDLEQTHAEILEAISWMCRDTHAWTSKVSRFQDVFKIVQS